MTSAVESALSWDFRNGTIPNGIEIVGEYEILVQTDGSTCLSIGPQSYINVS